MAWCGEDCVLLHWPGLGVLAVGSDGEWANFPYPAHAPLLLSPEPDCCRVVSPDACEVLQRVPAATEAINRIGSTDPAAMLYDSMEAFEDGDPKADENMRAMVRGSLVEAVRSCIAAALVEFDPTRQRQLLKAAAYGKGFLADYDADEFVDACRKLRVLNDVRRPEVGLPLTADQYDRLTPEVLVDRLVSRGRHFLALRCCEYLGLPSDRVVVRWACKKLAGAGAASLSDETLRDLIRAKLQAPPGRPRGGAVRNVSYAEIIRAADAAGKRGLAIMLLEYEPQAADQVSLLLSMREHKLALQKAIASGDPDLVYEALLHVEQEAYNSSAAGSSFYRLVDAHPEAMALLKAYYRHRSGYSEQRQMDNLCVWRGRFAEAAALAVRSAYLQERLPDRIEKLQEAEKLFAQVRELSFQREATREQAELLEAQQELERRTGLPVFVDMSLADTLYHVVSVAATRDAPATATAAALMPEAARLQRKFRVPDKRFWNIKVRALAAAGQWEQLRRFAAEKKSPVGYGPFARACIAHHQPAEDTEQYIDKIPAAEERYELYLEIRSWEKAAEAALKLKDPRRMAEVRKLAAGDGSGGGGVDGGGGGGGAALQARLDDALQRMTKQ
ncbi:unnamed protein product [Phaeothamnion confervicola]